MLLYHLAEMVHIKLPGTETTRSRASLSAVLSLWWNFRRRSVYPCIWQTAGIYKEVWQTGRWESAVMVCLHCCTKASVLCSTLFYCWIKLLKVLMNLVVQINVQVLLKLYYCNQHTALMSSSTTIKFGTLWVSVFLQPFALAVTTHITQDKITNYHYLQCAFGLH